jgi:hypothetical protein
VIKTSSHSHRHLKAPVPSEVSPARATFATTVPEHLAVAHPCLYKEFLLFWAIAPTSDFLQLVLEYSVYFFPLIYNFYLG